MSGKLTRSAMVVAALSIAAATPGYAAGKSCDQLASLKVKDLRIERAEVIKPDPLWAFPASLFNWMMPPGAGASKPFCRVTGVIEKEIRFEFWLPDAWNGRLQNVGNGGLTGAINYPMMSAALDAGYATASSDLGHQDSRNFFEIEWAVSHPDRVLNFAHRAHHLLAIDTKQILAAYYGKPQTYAYFNGCSSGGWQGLTEAQKYPGDYQGVLSGAPANNFTRLQSTGFWHAHLSALEPAGDLSALKTQMLADVAVALCDGNDGVRDGVIENPAACGFDPARLACKNDDRPDCLTPAQIRRAIQSYGPQKTPGGMWMYPGKPYGVPLDSSSGKARVDTGDPLILHILKNKPDFTDATFDYDRDVTLMDKELGPILDSYDSNLENFAGRGGKIILYHGWSDPLLSPFNTLQYFGEVGTTMGASRRDGFMKLFMAPGMEHCRGGVGPDDFDGMSPLVNWVEKGEAPVTIIARKVSTQGKTLRTRPWCVFPQIAAYRGSGSTDEAVNFACELAH